MVLLLMMVSVCVYSLDPSRMTCLGFEDFSYSLITKSKYDLLKGVLVLVLVN